MNKDLKQNLIKIGFETNKGNPKRCQHFLKVAELANFIGTAEQLDDYNLNVLNIAALLHDIGLKECEETYHSTAGNLQELVGADLAGEILGDLLVDEEIIDRVCFLISKHHTTNKIDDPLWQILVEADFLVNAYEDQMSPKQIKAFGQNVFKTKTGKELLENMFGLSI